MTRRLPIRVVVDITDGPDMITAGRHRPQRGPQPRDDGKNRHRVQSSMLQGTMASHHSMARCVRGPQPRDDGKNGNGRRLHFAGEDMRIGRSPQPRDSGH